jgi:hypothetical protein
MPALIPFLVFCQALGAFIGAFTAVWGEISYVRAMRDGRIDSAERTHLHLIAKGLRFGMTILLLASLGLVVANYLLQASLQPALSSDYWMSIAVAFLIILTAWALSKRHISFALGSAVIFASWWFLVFLTVGQLPLLTFSSGVALLVMATALFYAVLQYSRFLLLRK